MILTFPGVPSELRAMWRGTAAPLLKERFGSFVFWSRELKHFGIGESALAEQYAHLLELENPTVAPYAGRGECRLRVTAKASDPETARDLASPIIEEIQRGSKHRLYGYDDDTLETAVAKLLIERSCTISTAESCTGGLVSKRLTDIAGSSAYTKLNLVTYANEAKTEMLGVSEGLLAEHGAVSQECAKAMAEGLRKLTKADLALSVTGVAGPSGGTAEKPVGLVYLGLSTENEYFNYTVRLPADFSRDDVRFRTSSEALNMVRLYLIDPALIRR